MGPLKGQFTQNSNHSNQSSLACIDFFFFHFLSWFEFLCFVHISCKVVRSKLILCMLLLEAVAAQKKKKDDIKK